MARSRRPDVFGCRTRTRVDWRHELDRYRGDGLVALDAFTSGEGVPRPLAERLGWLVRIAVEHVKTLRAPDHQYPRLFDRTWEFRSLNGEMRRDSERGDVFCLFCCEPLLSFMWRRSKLLGVEIAYGKHALVYAHTTRCALQVLAGLREPAPYGSVTYPDPDSEVAPHGAAPTTPSRYALENDSRPNTNTNTTAAATLAIPISHNTTDGGP